MIKKFFPILLLSFSPLYCAVSDANTKGLGQYHAQRGMLSRDSISQNDVSLKTDYHSDESSLSKLSEDNGFTKVLIRIGNSQKVDKQEAQNVSPEPNVVLESNIVPNPNRDIQGLFFDLLVCVYLLDVHDRFFLLASKALGKTSILPQHFLKIYRAKILTTIKEVKNKKTFKPTGTLAQEFLNLLVALETGKGREETLETFPSDMSSVRSELEGKFDYSLAQFSAKSKQTMYALRNRGLSYGPRCQRVKRIVSRSSI